MAKNSMRIGDVRDQVPMLNMRKLMKNLNGGNLPENLSKELEGFVVEDGSRLIYRGNLRAGDVPDE